MSGPRDAEASAPAQGEKPSQTAAAATPERPEAARPGLDPQPSPRPPPHGAEQQGAGGAPQVSVPKPGSTRSRFFLVQYQRMKEIGKTTNFGSGPTSRPDPYSTNSNLLVSFRSGLRFYRLDATHKKGQKEKIWFAGYGTIAIDVYAGAELGSGQNEHKYDQNLIRLRTRNK